MKRIILFLITNLAIMFLMMVVFHVVCAFMGERWLVETVRSLADRANIKMPEVAIYKGDANAFATGAFRNHALVAVSTDIMAQMTREELRAVLGHEMSHVANGDMVTMTLLQGVLNACVIFLSRVVAFMAANAMSNGKGNRRGSSNGIYDRGPAPARQPRARRPARLDQGDGHRRQARIPLRHAPVARRPHRGARTPPARNLRKSESLGVNRGFWWREGDSNPQPADYDSDALPLSYLAGNRG